MTATAPAVMIGDLGAYTGGFTIPPGAYAMEFSVQMYEPAEEKARAKFGGARLGVVVKYHSLVEASQRGENALHAFYGMGNSAMQSFTPNPATGKGLVAIPGAPGGSLNNSTNWFVLLKSLYDSGLPAGVFTNDFSVLDGMHVTTALIDEPEERASFRSKTAEVQQEQRKNKICVVTEIHDDGKPWEGTGGIPAVGAGAPIPAAKTAATKPTARAAAPAAKAAPAAATTVDSADILEAAINCGSDILGNNAKGMAKVGFKTQAFSAVKAKYNDDMAQAVQNTFFLTDEATNGLLSQLGYAVVGAMVKPLPS